MARDVVVPVDPTRPPTLAVPVAAVVARQAGLGVDIVTAPPHGSGIVNPNCHVEQR